MRALVIGASGLLGNALLRSWSDKPGWTAFGTFHRFPLPGLAPLDVLDPAAVDAELARVRPEVVALPVSNPNVDYCESHPGETRAINVEATISAARKAAAVGARVVFFSSDYVFDGRRGGYREEDEPRPACEYGRQKLDVERALAGLGDRALVLRMSALFGWELRPKNFILQVLRRLGAGETMRVASDQDYNPTYAEDLVRVVTVLVERKAAGLLHAAGSQTLTRAEFAGLAADCFDLDRSLLIPGLLRDVAPPSAAPRPLHSALVSARAEALLGRTFWSARQGLENMKNVRVQWDAYASRALPQTL